MAGGMVPTVVNVIRAISSQGCGQSLSINAHVIVTFTGSGQFDSCHLAHHMDYVQGCLGL